MPDEQQVFGYNPPHPRQVNDRLYKWRWQRWKGRTDLFWLMRNVLGDLYNQVADVHRPVIEMLQQFPMTWEENCKLDLADEKAWALASKDMNKDAWRSTFSYWRPNRDRKTLPGVRRRLILDPRSYGKSTINAKAHTIQWLLNFPDMATIVVQANIQKAEDVLTAIRETFVSNQRFRMLYPEFVPWGNREIKEFGNRSRMWLPNRRQKDRSEPSVMTASIDGSMAGYHVEVLKFSDIVDEQNSITDGGLEMVKHKFAVAENVLVDPNDWIDVEGTRYSGADLYGKIIEDEQALPPERREWIIHARGVYKPKMPVNPETGKPFSYAHTPEELDYPFELDENKLPISWWPERWPTSKLENERQKNDAVFACQKLNNPSKTRDKVFSWDVARKKTRDEFKKVPIAYRTVTVDTAETVTLRSDYTVLTCVAWDGSGRGYAEEIRRGKFLPDQIIDHIFDMQTRYRPLNFKLEETAFVRGLKPSILRECAKRGIYPNLEFLKRETQTSKVDRIKLTLQPWIAKGDLIFVIDDTDPNIAHIRKELEDFPKGAHDDILDTLADQFQNREYFGRNVVRKSPEQVHNEAWERKLGWIEDDTVISSAYDSTGGL